MKVFIVTKTFGVSFNIMAVFSSKLLADAYVELECHSGIIHQVVVDAFKDETLNHLNKLAVLLQEG